MTEPEQSPASRREEMGPYQSSEAATADARDVYDLAPDEWNRANDAKLYTACVKAGVDLGDYDEQVIRWLSMWEPSAVQVIVGIIGRASRLRDIAGGDREAPTFFDRRAAKDPSVDHDSHSTSWVGPCPECPPDIAGGDQ